MKKDIFTRKQILTFPFTFGNRKGMKNISEEIKAFLAETGVRASELCRVAGVNKTCVSLLLSGKRKNVMGDTQDKLRAAMVNLKLAKVSR